MTFYNPKKPFRQVDLFLDNPIDFEQAYRRVRWFTFGGLRIPVASIDDLTAMKETTGRPRNQEDVHHLYEIRRHQGPR